jgi:hypothetical protein
LIQRATAIFDDSKEYFRKTHTFCLASEILSRRFRERLSFIDYRSL